MKRLFLALLFVALAAPGVAQQHAGDYGEDTTELVIEFTTSVGGVPTTLLGTPVVSVYKADNLTPSIVGVTFVVDFDGVTGLNNVKIDLSADAFYEVAKDYTLVITTGTVDGSSVVGHVVGGFSIENRNASGDVTAIAGSALAATNLSTSSQSMLVGTVDDSTFTPTTTVFEVSDITDAKADKYIGRVIIFTSGNLLREAYTISDYEQANSKGKFTVQSATSGPMTEIPATGDTFIII